MKWPALILTVAVLVGCEPRHTLTGAKVKPDAIPGYQLPQLRPTRWRTAEQFQFLQGGMSLSIVTNRVGRPDRELGSGQLRWEYDLADNSEMIILPAIGDYRDLSTWHVAWWGQRRGTNFSWTKPRDYK